MLDLIIPVYKNKAGLYRSLFSIGTETYKKVFVTIVDDCSGDNYDDIVEFFQKFFPIRVIYLQKNVGPGMARQAGLNAATQPYISFLDCGDTYITPTRLLECLNNVEDNPECVLFSWAHLEEKYDGQIGSSRFAYSSFFAGHNRMHGKIYKRNFLIEHDITFSEEGSRMNEDIGFNIIVRLCAEQAFRKDGIQRVWHSEDDAVVWKVSGPSIVRADECAFYYRDQNKGMSINGLHVLQHALNHNIDEDLILKEVYEEMVHAYVFYFAAKNARPEYERESFHGAAEYYINCFKPYGAKNPELLKDIYWDVLTSFLKDEEDPIRMKMVTLDFPGFLNQLEEYCAENNMNTLSQITHNTKCNDNGFKYNAT